MEDSRLKQSKTRVINMRRKRSLLDLTADEIGKNLRHYFKIVNGELKPPNLPINLLESLLRKLCAVRNEDYGELKSRIELLRSTLCPQTKNVLLLNLMSLHPATDRLLYKKVLKNLASRAPNIRSVTVESTDCKSRLFLFEQQFIDQIGKLGKLTSLEISSHQVCLSDLKELCRKLENLSRLNVIISFDCLVFEDVQGITSSFYRLQSFLFRHHPPDDMHSMEMVYRLMHVCIQHLPNLRHVGNDNFPPLRCLLQEDLPLVPSNLRHLSTFPGPIDLRLVFPHLVSLMVGFKAGCAYNDREIRPLLRFAKLEKLHLRNVPPKMILSQFLQAYGMNLTHLRIDSLNASPMDLSLKSTLKVCPQLESLVLRNVDLTDDSEDVNISPQLKSLHWWLMLSTKTATLSKILSASNLERISILCSRVLDANDLVKISSLIAKGQILRKLNSLHFYSHLDDSLEAMADLLKNASAYLPKLAFLRWDLQMSSAFWCNFVENHPKNARVADPSVKFFNYFGGFSRIFGAFENTQIKIGQPDGENSVTICMEGFVNL